MTRALKLLFSLACFVTTLSLLSSVAHPGVAFAKLRPPSGQCNSLLTSNIGAVTRDVQNLSATVTFSWYVNDAVVVLAPDTWTVKARVALSNATNGHYTLYVYRDVAGWFDDVVASSGFDYAGGAATTDLPFTPPYATGVASTNGYYLELVESTPTQYTWQMANSYPPRLTVGYNLTVQVNPPGAGTISLSSPAQQTTSTTFSNSYAPNTPVTIGASPNDGFQFTGWSGAISGSTTPQTVAMTANKIVTANFDSIGTCKISDAWLSNVVDDDNDGYISQFDLNWATAANSSGNSQLQTIVSLAGTSGVESEVARSTPYSPGVQQSITIKASDFAFILHDSYNLIIRLYDADNLLAALDSRGSWNDADLAGIKLEQASDDATLTVQNLVSCNI